MNACHIAGFVSFDATHTTLPGVHKKERPARLYCTAAKCLTARGTPIVNMVFDIDLGRLSRSLCCFLELPRSKQPVEILAH